MYLFYLVIPVAIFVIWWLLGKVKPRLGENETEFKQKNAKFRKIIYILGFVSLVLCVLKIAADVREEEQIKAEIQKQQEMQQPDMQLNLLN